MKCDKSIEITAYLKGEAPEAEREPLRLHFESCPVCSKELEKFDRLLKALGKMETVDPSPGFRWRVREAFLRAHPEFLEAPKPSEPLTLWQSLRQSFAYVPAWAISVAAHVILMATAAILFFTPKSTEEVERERIIQAKPRQPGGAPPEFPSPGGFRGKGGPDFRAHVEDAPRVERDFTENPVRPDIKLPPPPTRNRDEKFDSKQFERVQRKDKTLLAFLSGRVSETQRRDMRQVYSGEGTEKAIRAALDWLARNQQPNGSWPAVKVDDGSDSNYTIGLTGLSLLAFLAEGHTGKSGDYPRTVQKGLEYLLGEQRQSGRIGADQGNYMYNHALGGLALLEAYLMTKDESLAVPASLAVAYTVQAQNEEGGWGYTSRSIENDTSVGGWQVLLLRVALLGGNQGVIGSLLRAHDRVKAMTDAEGKVGYRMRSQYPNGYLGLTAVGMLSLQLSHHTPDRDVLAKQADVLLERPAVPGVEPAHFMMNDLYFAYFGSLAMHQYGEGAWAKWWSPLRDKLLKTQTAEGSWPANFDRWWAKGGQVYTTAMATLVLETPVRYPRLFD
jgi:hypothetical protein